ncbi:MAG: exodeoxyribonuclease VII large subunit [Anaerofustis stercorihominis]|nr:exodeoxyribonuclease VII large subunit [Anaerofustis stercorihominis]
MSDTISVTQLNNYISALLEFDTNLANISVSGELSNVKIHSSGHIYFTLKDDSAKVNGVIFKNRIYSLGFVPKDGLKVIVSGRISVYTKNGTYQIIANDIRKVGHGDLYEAYLKLLDRFRERGYFDPENKKSLPSMPKTIALITSPTGAAVRDMISVISRRNPSVKLIVCPVLVQGSGAARQISEMIDYVNANKLADLIITGRGGGSIEELWAFNEEAVATSVFNSDIPVISAVGHETDFTICDFVADVRAATPSVAGELAVADLNELYSAVNARKKLLTDILSSKITVAKRRIQEIRDKDLTIRLRKITDTKKLTLSYLSEALNKNISVRIESEKSKIEKNRSILKASSIDSVLNRGFWIAEKGGKVLMPQDISTGDAIVFRSGNKEAASLITDLRNTANE